MIDVKTYDKHVQEEHYYILETISVIMRHIPSRPDLKRFRFWLWNWPCWKGTNGLLKKKILIII